jgi:fructose-1,6-bisphosphatase II
MPTPLPNIALDLVQVTESAVLAAIQWDNNGFQNPDRESCMNAIRKSFRTIDIDGAIICGRENQSSRAMLNRGVKKCAG